MKVPWEQNEDRKRKNKKDAASHLIIFVWSPILVLFLLQSPLRVKRFRGLLLDTDNF